MPRYFIEPRTRKYAKEDGCLSLARKYQTQLIDTGVDVVKTPSKKVVYKAGEFLGNKIADTLSQTMLKLENLTKIQGILRTKYQIQEVQRLSVF